MAIEILSPVASTGISNSSGIFSMLVKVEVASIRMTWEGTVPTDATGILMSAGDSIMIEGEARCRRFRCIEAAQGNGAQVIVMY